MPRLSVVPAPYYYLFGPNGTKPVAGKALEYEIIHPSDQERYRIIGGVYDSADTPFLGECSYFDRPETMPYYVHSTLDAMVRGGPKIRVRVAERLDFLRDLHSQVSQLNQVLAHSWYEFRDDNQDKPIAEVLYYAFGAYLNTLDRAKTRARRKALEGLAPALSVRDSLGRTNPNASAARLVNVAKQLIEQLKRDKRTDKSLLTRWIIATDALSDDIEVALAIESMALSDMSDAEFVSIIKPLLATLLAKPFLYPAMYASYLLESKGLANHHIRKNIALAFATERGLLDYNATLSAMRDHIHHMTVEAFDTVAHSLDYMEFDDPYTSLVKELTILLSEIGDCIEQGPKSFSKARKAIEQSKIRLRYRIIFDVPGAWSTAVTTDQYGNLVSVTSNCPVLVS